MIITVTANPMLDKTLRVPMLEKGRTHRADSASAIVGGKGINVSRQLHLLGAETVATGFLGGPVGEQIRSMMSAEKLRHDFVTVSSNTREGLTILEESGVWTAVFEPSGSVSPEEKNELLERLSSLAKPGDWVAICGSVPHSELDTLYREIIDWATGEGVFSFLDTHGQPLNEVWKGTAPTISKMNQQEYEGCTGKQLQTDDDFRQAAQALSRGSGIGLLTQGKGAFYGAHAGAVFRGTPPVVKEVNGVGSGDAMSAAFLWKWNSTGDLEDALRWGAAAGAANAAKWSVSDSSPQEIEALLPGVKIVRQ